MHRLFLCLKLRAVNTKKKFDQYKVEQEQILDTLNKHKDANLKYYEMGVTVLQVAKLAWRIYINRSEKEMVDDKRLLLSLLFSNATLNGKIAQVSYHKAFKIIFDHVGELVGEKLDQKKIFEHLIQPVNKEKNGRFASVHPIWLHTLNEIRTHFRQTPDE